MPPPRRPKPPLERADDLDAGDLAQLRLQACGDLRLVLVALGIVLEPADGVELVDLRLADIDEIGAHVGRVREDPLDLRRHSGR